MTTKKSDLFKIEDPDNLKSIPKIPEGYDAVEVLYDAKTHRPSWYRYLRMDNDN